MRLVVSLIVALLFLGLLGGCRPHCLRCCGDGSSVSRRPLLFERLRSRMHARHHGHGPGLGCLDGCFGE